jgi:DNA (cytosine-5)-methyltransferase 1
MGSRNVPNKLFIDLFAGCGGLSLGLINAGWQGIFAIEKSPEAFETLKHNLIERDVVTGFKWPDWLPCSHMTTSELIAGYSIQLKNLRGKIDLIAGGPPCQGFSFAGRRNPNDPRNRLTEEYIHIVSLMRPKFLLIENVKGFASAFNQNSSDDGKVYADIVKEKLEGLGYIVYHKMLNSSKFGVPQSRTRFIMVASYKDIPIVEPPFGLLERYLPIFRKGKGLHPENDITVCEAISDLEVDGAAIKPCMDTKGFFQIRYKEAELSPYQSLMRNKCRPDAEPNSLRLARHKDKTINRFEKVLEFCDKGKSIPKAKLEELGTKKRCFTPLHPDKPARTITTLPDDLLHYSEPRILTVRENARIQSFPDWFGFMGKYTTGGIRRKDECPRYSQVGNAVPPLMAEALGKVIEKWGVSNGT